MLVEHPHGLGLMFITPWMVLLGSCGILVPLTIHLLFRRRRSPMQWAAMHFVMQAWASRRSRVRIEQLLLLISRCLIPLLLGLALAQPVLDSSWFSSGIVNRYIIIGDGITSMTRIDNSRTDLEHTKENVLRYLESVPPGDPITIIAMSSNEPTVPTTSPRAIRRFVDRIGSTHLPTDLRSSIETASGLIAGLADGERSEIVLAGGHRMGSFSESRDERIEMDESTTLVRITPSPALGVNQRLENVVPNRSFIIVDRDGSERMRNIHSSTATVVIARDGPDYPSGNTSIIARGTNGESVREIEWVEGRREMVTTIDLPVEGSSGGDEMFEIELLPSDALPDDNRWYLNIGSVEEIDILILDRSTSDSTDWLSYALNPMSSESVSVRTIDPVSLIESDLRRTDMVFVVRPDLVPPDTTGILLSHLESGGSIVVTPPDSTDHRWVESWNTTFDVPWEWNEQTLVHDRPTTLLMADDHSNTLKSISTEVESLLGPVTVDRIQMITTRDGCERIFVTSDGDPFLITSNDSGSSPGSITAFASPMNTEWTDLPTRPLMVPLVQELVRDAVSRRSKDTQHTVGVPVSTTSGRFESVRSSGVPVRNPDRPQIVFFDAPGHWIHRDDSSIPSRIHSSNIASGSSSTTPIGDTDFESLVNHPTGWRIFDPEQPRNREGTGSPITRYLLLLLLMVTVGETVMSRLFSHARGGGSRP